MKTTLICIRHAETMQTPDFTRPISEEGRKTQEKCCLFLKKKGVVPDAIWSSPSLRTQETAHILSTHFDIAYREEKALGFSFDIDIMLAEIEERVYGKTVFLVSHGPILLQFATMLLKEPTPIEYLDNSSALFLYFEKKIAKNSALFDGYYEKKDYE